MILRPYSYNGTSILTNTSTDYKGEIPRAFSPLQMKTRAIYVKRAGTHPIISGKDFQPTNLVLEIEAVHDFMTVFESLNQLFDTKDETPRQLIMQDTEDTSAENPKQYYLYATPSDVAGGHDGPMATVTLALDDPIWQSVTQNSQTFSTTSSTSSTDVTNNGNDNAYPIFEITPATQPSTDYLYNTYVQVLPQSETPWSNRFLDLCGSTDTTFDTVALVAAGKVQANGDDLRIFRDGLEVDRWLDGMNTTDTHIIVRCSLPGRRNMTLKTALVSTDTITEIELNYTTANKNNITLCPDSGRLILDTSIGSTDTEEFTYTDRTITGTKLAFTINSSGVRNTSRFNHAVNDNVRFLPFDFNILYGSATATAPVTDDTRQPQPSLTSRNNSFLYDSTSGFADEAGLRPNRWRQISRVVSDANLSRSNYYTSTGDAGDTDPNTEMGNAAYTFEAGGLWRADTVRMGWLGYFPDDVATVSAVIGEQSQSSVSWPSLALQGSVNNINYYNLWTVSAQTTTDYSTFTAFTKASTDAVLITNTRYLRFLQSGTILGSTDYYAKGGITSITVGLTNYPHVMLRTEANNHKLDCTITNETTGESIRVIYPLTVGDTLIVDTDPEFPTAKHKGLIVSAVSISATRSAWLKLTPGSNTLSYQTNLAVATDMSIVIKWRDRMNYF